MRWVAPKAWPMTRASSFWPLNLKAELRATTRKSGTFASAPAISSVMPSEKNSCSLSEDRFAKGMTAMEMALPGLSEAFRAALTPACCVCTVRAPESGAICWYTNIAITVTSAPISTQSSFPVDTRDSAPSAGPPSCIQAKSIATGNP